VPGAIESESAAAGADSPRAAAMTRSPVRTLLHVFPTFDVGGAQMRFVQLANHFGRRYRHLIVAMDGSTDACARLDGEVEAAILSVPVVPNRTLANLGTFRRQLRSLKPDLLVTSNWGTIEWAMANLAVGVPHLHMEDGFGPEETDHQIARRVWTRRLTLRRSTVLLPSQTLCRIARRQWRIPEANLLYVPNGIDCDRFAAGADRTLAARYGLSVGGDPIIGTVAGLRAEKNPRRLIDAFAIVVRRRPARLVLVGDGAEREALEQHARALGLAERVIFTGNCPAPEKLLPLFDVFALSSDTEQMPLSILEAMAAALPIAATDVGDVAAMVAEDSRPYVVPRDPARLADAMLALLDDSARAADIGAANARRAREQFAQQRMFDSFQRLFDGHVVRRRRAIQL
jgi:glycosyltransferase involved in cell wall biosynthesis